jgi:hypothetical protein
MLLTSRTGCPLISSSGLYGFPHRSRPEWSRKTANGRSLISAIVDVRLRTIKREVFGSGLANHSAGKGSSASCCYSKCPTLCNPVTIHLPIVISSISRRCQVLRCGTAQGTSRACDPFGDGVLAAVLPVLTPTETADNTTEVLLSGFRNRKVTCSSYFAFESKPKSLDLYATRPRFGLLCHFVATTLFRQLVQCTQRLQRDSSKASCLCL